MAQNLDTRVRNHVPIHRKIVMILLLFDTCGIFAKFKGIRTSLEKIIRNSEQVRKISLFKLLNIFEIKKSYEEYLRPFYSCVVLFTQPFKISKY
jgi:hypothetical protein